MSQKQILVKGLMIILVYLNSNFHHDTQVSKSIFHFNDKVSRGRFKKTVRTNHAVIDFLMFWWLKSWKNEPQNNFNGEEMKKKS